MAMIHRRLGPAKSPVEIDTPDGKQKSVAK